MFPVRCYTCNTVLAHHHGAYLTRTRAGEATAAILDDLGVTLMCCRRMFIAHVESLIVNQMDYPNKNIVLDRGGTTLFRECTTEQCVQCD